MTLQQKAFCEYYVACKNATEAALKAGYSEKTARSIGSENLTKPDIKKYIDELNQEIRSPRIAEMTEVQEFWTETMRNKKAKMSDRLKASENIAKTNGAFLDKVEVKGEVKTNNPFSGLTTEELKKVVFGDK